MVGDPVEHYAAPQKTNALSIVVAHDYLTQRGGAERVALELAKMFHPKQVVSALYHPDETYSGFLKFSVRPSILNKFRVFRSDPRRALPFLAAAWNMYPDVDADAVVCSSSGWSHGVPTSARTKKIVYCHNPPRWLYQESDYIVDRSAVVRTVLRLLRPFLLKWDQRAAASADVYIANSSSVAKRIQSAYGRDPIILFPPVSVDTDGPQEAVNGVDGPFFLTVGRSRGYKGTSLLAEAFGGMPKEKLVVVGAPLGSDYGSNIISLGRVTESQLRWLYSHARALISVSKEDFGLTPIEANAFGTPVLLLRAGGFLDSTAEGVSGCFIEQANLDWISDAVRNFPCNWNRDAIKSHAEKFSREEFSKRLMKIVQDCIGQ